MSGKGVARKSKKTQKRVEIIDRIIGKLKSEEIFKVIDYRRQDEGKIKQFIYRPLLEELQRIYMKDFGVRQEIAKEKVKNILLWEGNVNTTVHNNLFLGTNHRPDMEIDFNLSRMKQSTTKNISDGMRIAIEIKRGDQGSAIREGIGQALIYSNFFDFVVYLFIDTSKEKKIVNAITSDKEAAFIEALWEQNNVRFDVV